MDSHTERFFVVSFHDLSPGSLSICQRFLSRLNAEGIQTANLLAVPNWHQKEEIRNDPSFMKALRRLAEQGYEICLHGHTHTANEVRGGLLARLIGTIYTNHEGEYHQIAHEHAMQILTSDLDFFRAEGLPIQGFVPPAWLLSQEGREALRAQGLLYTTTLSTLHLLQTGQTIYSPALVYSCRSAWRRRLSKRWISFWLSANRSTPYLRLAVHPCDFLYPEIEAHWFHVIREVLVSRTPTNYLHIAERVLTTRNG